MFGLHHPTMSCGSRRISSRIALPRAETSVAILFCLATALSVGCGKKPDALVNPQTGPSAAFTATPRNGTRPLDVNFSDQSVPGTSPITSWLWSFGDGSTSNSRNPGYLYGNPGKYTITLTVTTAIGTDLETKVDYITVADTQPTQPTADFSALPTRGPPPLAVQFTDLSTSGSSPITAWSWSFGDGSASTSQSPGHTYANAGSYSVSLTVTTADGQGTNTKADYVAVTDPVVPPTAGFSGSPTSGVAPLTVQFVDQSNPGSASITSRLGSFGDGGTSTAQDPGHTYADPGSYTVSLTVTTSVGSDSLTKTDYITVSVCEPPAADFVGVPTTGVAPLNVQFTDLSVPGDITGWSWSFGDGGTSTQQNPSHTYTVPGTYDVSVTVANACRTDSVAKPSYVVVEDACPNPTYSIVDASWSNVSDGDQDGFAERAHLSWNADVDSACTRSVFARVFYRLAGDTAASWTLEGETACYTITGTSEADVASLNVSGLSRACYEFRIVLYECLGTTEVAARGRLEDADLDNQCFEPRK